MSATGRLHSRTAEQTVQIVKSSHHGQSTRNELCGFHHAVLPLTSLKPATMLTALFNDM